MAPSPFTQTPGFSTIFFNSSGRHGRFHAVREGMPEFLNIRCHEAGSYDVLLDGLLSRKELWPRPPK